METAAASAAAAAAAEKDSHVTSFHRDILCCFLCRGFLIDATTITECMHTFCKSCLLQRLESIPSCPTCGVQLQRSRIGEQLRLDHLVQNIVYKCVPGLWHEEQRRRKQFSDTHPLGNTSLASVVPILAPPLCFSPEDSISLSIDYLQPEEKESQQPAKLKLPDNITRRYYRCPAAVTVHSFQRLLSLKFDVGPDYKVELLYDNEKLKTQHRLMDIAYIYSWTQAEPLRLQFRVSPKRPSSKSQPSSTNATLTVQTASIATSSSSPKSLRIKTPASPSSATSSATSPLKRNRGVSPSVASPPVVKKPKPDKKVATPVTNKKTTAASAKPSARGHWRKTRNSSDTQTRGSVYQAVHQMLKKKLPALLSNASTKGTDKNRTPDTIPEESSRMEEVSPTWQRPSNGVELLVKAAELASQQCPTPPPSSSSESESIRSTPSGSASVTEKPQQSPNGSLVIVEDEEEILEPEEKEEQQDPPPQESPPPPSNSETALDLSSKSSRIHLDPGGTGASKPSKPTLHSITESLAQRQQQLLQAKQQPADAMRNLLTLSQTAALVASARPRSVVQPVNTERAAAQRLLAAMQRTFATFSSQQQSTVAVPSVSSTKSKSSALNIVQRPS